MQDNVNLIAILLDYNNYRFLNNTAHVSLSHLVQQLNLLYSITTVLPQLLEYNINISLITALLE